MKISELAIDNYKSLRHVQLKPERFGVIVGPNAAGKSNFADCLDFMSEVYRHGLELAVARKGGYENIAHRKERRSKSAIKLDVTAEFDSPLRNRGAQSRESSRSLPVATVRARHAFSLRAAGESVGAPFHVVSEFLQLDTLQGKQWLRLLTLERSRSETRIRVDEEVQTSLALPDAAKEVRDSILGPYAINFLRQAQPHVESTELLVTAFRGMVGALRQFLAALGNVRVFQPSPSASREYGVPTPGAELARSGENLPAVVDLLKRRYPDEWAQVVTAMGLVLPSLESIDVGYSKSRTLELAFQERGYGRAWTMGEVSDGTVQTLALMVAIHDPRATALVLEEPENSIHPWVVRHVLDACMEASKRRQVLVTTHSPIVVNHVRPEQVWLIWRRRGESRVARLVDLRHDVLRLWEDGHVSTFEFLDSGDLDEAIPPAPEVAVDEARTRERPKSIPNAKREGGGKDGRR